MKNKLQAYEITYEDIVDYSHFIGTVFIYRDKSEYGRDDRNTEIQILPVRPIPRNVIQKPCKVWNHTDFITVDFLQGVGEVCIKIIDEVGATVVNDVVNSNTVGTVRISTVQLPTGNYTLRLEMGQVFGGVYVGMFYK